MRCSLFLLALPLAACGPDLSAWAGTWSGNAAVNTGRQPEIAPASFTFAEARDATFTLGPWGAPARTFTCGLVASEADAAKATLVSQSACTVERGAGDDCTAELSFGVVTLTRAGETLDASLSGRLNSTCPGGSGSVVDVGVRLTATRK